MKSIKLSTLLIAIMFVFVTAFAQSKTVTTETFKVYGNCEMCKSTIEKAVTKNKDVKGTWNEETKMLVVHYDANTTSSVAILKRVADAGYDNERFVAHASAYNKLPGCCKYDRMETVYTTKESKTSNAHTDHNMDEMPTEKAKVANEMNKHEGHNHAAMPGSTDDKVPSKQMEQIKTDTGLSALLTNYYSIKDALVKTDGAAASAKATEFLTVIKAIDMTAMSEAEHNAFMPLQQKLISDAEQIAATKDVEHQRDHFNDFSNNMFALAKTIKVSAKPVYQQYCPMKKTYWLSSESAIKNPYYGNQMLTCGNVSATIK